MRTVAGVKAAGAVLVVLSALLSAAACSVQLGTPPSTGPRKQVCGAWIGRADTLAFSGPFYLDGSTSDVRVSAMARSSGTWVRVSDDCDSGSVVTVPVSASVVICDELPAGPGADLAVLLTPVDPGSAALRVTHGDGSVTHIDVSVTTGIRADTSPPVTC